MKLFPFATKMGPAKVGWRDHLFGAFLGSAYVAWLLATARELGFARDEGFYFRAAMTYWRWYDTLFTKPSEAFKQGFIDSIWSTNHEHPPLMKALFAFSWHFFHEKWHVFDDASTAFRFPGMVMTGLAMWITYLFGARAYSRRAGAIAALLFGLMPRVFYNAHLDCFDLGIVTMWTWVMYVYWRTQSQTETKQGWLWALGTAGAFGLALATKHNAWIIPAVVVPHAILSNWKDPLGAIKTGRLPVLVLMGLIGPAIWYALWPWMWHDLPERLDEYVAFMVNHAYYNMEFLHVNYYGPPSPRLYMPVMILGTVPAITLALFASGFFLRAKIHVERLRSWLAAQKRKSETKTETEGAKPDVVTTPHDPETDLLFLLAFGAALGPWLLPKTPIFGGTKHWMTAYPFLCLFAGYGFERACEAMNRTLGTLKAVQENPRLLLGAQAALFASVLVGPLLITAHSHPFGLSSYTPLVGGTAGGADLGLNRQFWGFTTESLAPYFEANAPKGATVYFNDTAWDSWSRMIDEKRVRPDLRGVGSINEAEIAITHIELHMMEVEYKEWVVFGTDVPDYVLTQDGVPIVDVFRRKR